MRTSVLLVVTICILLLGANGVAVAQDYVGDSTCAQCHNVVNPSVGYNIYEEYQKTGHPYKLNPVSGAPPMYPLNTSPGVPNPPLGTTWGDFAFVIGGYGWKARWVKPDGRIYTVGDSAQYNLEDQSWVAYHKGEDKKYNYGCFVCHTSNPMPDGSWNNVPADSLGMFAQPGVRCEACHGNAGQHVFNPSIKPFYTGDTLKIDRCGDCHNRDSKTNAIPASGNYIRHHEQLNEMKASKHRDGKGGELTCASCHNTHIPLRYPEAAGAGLSGIKTECQTCHSGREVMLNGSPKGLECADCHMPPASKSAVGMQAGNGWRGDVKTHIFHINTDPVPRDSMFTADGTLVRLDADGLAAVTLDFVCLRCHTTKDLAWASANAPDVHSGGLVDVTKTGGEVPGEFALAQNFPNPFNPSTTISFALPKASSVRLSIYDLSGQLMGTLVDQRMPAGSHSVTLDASDLASGVYLYRIQADGFVSARKMVLLK